MLATAAAVIASQATITGAFSVTRQAIQLDLLPRLRILQTSAHEHGQIYVPIVNCRVLVAGVRVRARLRLLGRARRGLRRRRRRHDGHHHAARLVLAASRWGWRRWQIGAIFGPLLLIDVVYVCANLAKFCEGAWVPLAAGARCCSASS